MKKGIIYVLIFVFLCATGNFISDYSFARQIEGRSPYSLCFASIGAISLESRMDCWAKLKSSLDNKKMRKELEKAQDSLELSPADGRTTFNRQGQIRKLSYTAIKKGVGYQIVITSDTKKRVTDFACTAKTRDRSVNLQKMAASLSANGRLKWKTYYLYSGRLPEPINAAAQKELMRIILKNFKSQEITRFHDTRMTVATAYSPLVNVDSVKLAGRQCNLQASVRRDTITNKTYIYIGSPLILGDY